MTDIRRVGDSGIHTVEGTVAGNRAAVLTKKREQQQQEYEEVKRKIKEDNAAGIGKIDQKFSSATDVLEQEFRRKTVGLVSADDFRKAREEATENTAELAKKQQEKLKQIEDKKLEVRELKRKKVASTLSFQCDDDEAGDADDGEVFTKKRLKDPTVDTSYLPDRERDRELKEKREKLQQEWVEQQTKIKNEVIFHTKML
jgi:protein FAM50